MFYNLIHVFVLIIYYNFKYKYGWYTIYNLKKTYVNIFKILMCENLKTSTEREKYHLIHYDTMKQLCIIR